MSTNKQNGFLAPGILMKYWLTFFATLSNACFMITQFSQMFYVQFQEVFNLTNTQIGILEGIGSIGGFIGGFVGGLMADRFSPRKLTALGCIITGVAALAESVVHSYFFLVVIYFALYFCSNVLLMTPYFKLLKLLGTDEEQGKIMTFSETAFAIVTLIINYGFLGAIEAMGLSFQSSLRVVGIVCMLIGIGIWAFFKAPGLTAEENRIAELKNRKTEKQQKSAAPSGAIAEFIAVLKCPILYLNIIATMTLTFYNQVVFTYMNPFLVNVLALTAGAASLYAITFKNVLRIFVSPFGGIVRDKLNDSTAVLKVMSLVLAVVMVIFAVAGGSSLVLYLAMVVLAGICIFSVTGLQYTLIADAKLPAKYSGRIFGITFSLNSLTTLFRGTVCGGLLDELGYTAGFTAIFWIGLASCLLCAASAVVLRKVIVSKKALSREIQAEVDAAEAVA